MTRTALAHAGYLHGNIFIRFIKHKNIQRFMNGAVVGAAQPLVGGEDNKMDFRNLIPSPRYRMRKAGAGGVNVPGYLFSQRFEQAQGRLQAKKFAQLDRGDHIHGPHDFLHVFER